MKKNIVLFCLCNMFILSAVAQNWSDPLSARNIGMGNIKSVLVGNDAVYSNQAALAKVDKISFLGAFSNYYGIGFTSKSFGVALPVKTGALAFSVKNLGLLSFKEQKAAVAYGRSFGNIDFGMQIDYLRVNIEQRIQSTVSFELSLLTHITSQLDVGFQVFNPTVSNLGINGNQGYPSALAIGTSYKASDKVKIAAEFEKIASTNPFVKIGFEYIPSDLVFLRGGLNPGRKEYSLGLGTKYKGIHLDFASALNLTLGFSPHFSLLYEIN